MQAKVHTKVLLVRPDGCILVVKRSPDDERRAGEWDFPGGGVEPGENPTQGAVREVMEEVGVQLAPEDLTLFYAATAAYKPKDDSNTRIMYFCMVDDASVTNIALSHEHTEYKWEPPYETVTNFPHSVYVLGLQYALQNKLLPVM